MKAGSVSHCLLAKLKMELKTGCTLGSTAVDCWSQAGLELVFEGVLLFLVHLFPNHSFIIHLANNCLWSQRYKLRARCRNIWLEGYSFGLSKHNKGQDFKCESEEATMCGETQKVDRCVTGVSEQSFLGSRVSVYKGSGAGRAYLLL